jgi:hypothetical protein
MSSSQSKDLDKFYTDPQVADLCASVFYKYVEQGAEVVEPSAGAGAFAPYVTKMYDILPEGPGIQQADFLSMRIEDKYFLGNPPFGKNSSLAKKFFNHAAKGKGVIGFIVPKTFRKVSIQNALDLHFHLNEELEIPEKSFTLDGKPYAVPCVFQVWEYKQTPRTKITLPTTHSDFKFVTSENADFSIRRVGGNAGKVNEHNNYAAASNYFIQGDVKDRFIELEPEFRDAAKNTAGNPSLSKGELIYLYSKKFANIPKNIS